MITVFAKKIKTTTTGTPTSTMGGKTTAIFAKKTRTDTPAMGGEWQRICKNIICMHRCLSKGTKCKHEATMLDKKKSFLSILDKTKKQ